MSIAATVTVVRKAGGPCTKRITLGPDGRPLSDGSACAMSRGEAERREYNGSPASELAADIRGLKPFEAIILGDLADGIPPKIEIDLAKRTGTAKAKAKVTYSRTRGTFVYRPGRLAFVLADFDTKGMPAAARDASTCSAGSAWL